MKGIIMISRLKRLAVAATVALGLAGGIAPEPSFAGSPNEQFIPLATFRVGAYASSGIPVWNGIIDTLRYINEVQGGINGVKLFWAECETEWEVEKGVECYERFHKGLDGSPVAIYLPNGDPIAKALLQRATADKIPIPTLNYGPDESVDGRVFPYAFPLMLSFYSEASTAINYIAQVSAARTSSRVSGSRRSIMTRPMARKHSRRWPCSPRPMVSRTSRFRCRIPATINPRNGPAYAKSNPTGSSCAGGV